MAKLAEEKRKEIYRKIFANPAFQEVANMREVNSADKFDPQKALKAARDGREKSRQALKDLEAIL